LFLAKLGVSADEAGGSSAGKGITMAKFEQAVGTGVRNVHNPAILEFLAENIFHCTRYFPAKRATPRGPHVPQD